MELKNAIHNLAYLLAGVELAYVMTDKRVQWSDEGRDCLLTAAAICCGLPALQKDAAETMVEERDAAFSEAMQRSDLHVQRVTDLLGLLGEGSYFEEFDQ